MPSRDALTKAWGDVILGSLTGRAKARFGAGRFLAVEGGAAVFALPNQHYLGRCEEVRPEVEAALASHFATAVPLRLVVEQPGAVPGPEAGAVPAPDDDEAVHDFASDEAPRDAPPAITSPEEQLKRVFPGAEEVPT